MAVVRIRLCDADRERYGVGDLELDTEALKDLSADELDDIDQQMDIVVAAIVDVLEGPGVLPRVTRFRRAMVWLALRTSGHDTTWADTAAAKVLRAEFDREDTRPPAGPSESSSEDDRSA